MDFQKPIIVFKYNVSMDSTWLVECPHWWSIGIWYDCIDTKKGQWKKYYMLNYISIFWSWISFKCKISYVMLGCIKSKKKKSTNF